ncbi:MAG: hypothetical protein ACR65X_09595 [Methylocystis sp.]
MTTHKVLIEGSDSEWRVFASGASLGVVSRPISGTARLLLERGIASPSDTLEVRIDQAGGEEIVARTTIGAAARLETQAG